MAKEKKGNTTSKTRARKLSSYSTIPVDVDELSSVVVEDYDSKPLIGRRSIPESMSSATAFMLEPGHTMAPTRTSGPEITSSWWKRRLVSGETRPFWAAGTVTYCPPNMSHAMRVTSKEPLRAIVVNWAPGGNDEVWKTGVVMLDE